MKGNRMKEMKKIGTLAGTVFILLFLGMIVTAGTHIEIRELGIDETQNSTGFIDFKNVVDNIFLEEDEEYIVTGLITVYNNGILILEEEVKLKVISFHGFAVNRPETIEFEINMTEGSHKLTAYIESENVTNEAICEYNGNIEKEEEEETEGDWLSCPSVAKCIVK